MKPKYEEAIEIIAKIDGTLLAMLTWRDHTFHEELPRGFDRWPEAEFKSHLRSFVIPKLRLALLKVQREALEAGSVPVEECVPVMEYSDRDMEALRKAEEKRERKTVKLKATLN